MQKQNEFKSTMGSKANLQQVFPEIRRIQRAGTLMLPIKRIHKKEGGKIPPSFHGEISQMQRRK